MISTIKQTKQPLFLKILKTIIIATFWIFVWEAASRLVSRNNEVLLLVFPGPFTVFKTWCKIAFTKPFINAGIFTLSRVFLGFLVGVLSGVLIGILTHISSLICALFSPIIKFMRAVPIVAIIILMYLLFESSVLPIIIVCLMVLPLIWQTVHDGLENTDQKLLEMASAYNMSPAKTIFLIKLPSLTQNFASACINAQGLAWKSGVAAEIICLPDISFGTMIWRGKGVMEYTEVYAVTLTVVFISIAIEFLLKFFYKKFLADGGIDDV